MGETAYCMTAFCVFLYCLPWAIAFGIRRSLTNVAECHGPSWFWTGIAVIHFVWACVGCVVYICLQFFQDFVPKTLAKIALRISFFPIIGGAPVAVGLIISYGRRFECPELEGVLTTWFVLTMSLLAVPYLIISLAFYSGCTAYLGDKFGRLTGERHNEHNDRVFELRTPLSSIKRGRDEELSPIISSNMNK